VRLGFVNLDVLHCRTLGLRLISLV
jgi:hypothetical protein